MLRGTANTYPYGQCTWWAAQRFHDVTGVFIPWMGDAHSWNALAAGSGWTVTSQPVNGPAIVCLQSLVQGAGILGHVAYVEAVQNANTVVTSNMNWGSTRAEQLSVQTVTFHTGPGVSFISMGGTPVPSNIHTVYNTAVGIPGLPDFSFLTNALGQLSTLGQWFSNPVRVFKMIGGVALLLIALYMLIEPDAANVAITAVKAGVLA